MSVIPQTPVSEIKITWPKLPDDFVLPDDPVENTEHPLLANALSQALPSALAEEALIVANFALCAEINNRTIVKAPDWMYVRPIEPWPHPYPRRSYTPHTEGPVPLVVMEFLSDTYGEEYSVEFQQRIGKWYFYERVVKVPIYAIFKAQTATLEVYQLESDRYQIQTTNVEGRYWIPGLELFLGVWQGKRANRTGYWLRWWNAEGELLLWPEERAEQERQRAERLAQRLRDLGVDPDS
ncbi:Uma2 family endonuclease [Oscillatoria sp. HE19RPO]|uniref:Uma2 family endonuclease n=1 Tax=Oscillatoria sp. HE19RPO TaxID=2954806 RepID=UPI0020C240A4|nr:Uma2 family endonuclease [Oscillatoria sp. HE19RPO]